MSEELKAWGIETDVRPNDFFAAQIQDGNIETLCESYLCCIYLDKDKYMSAMLEKSGLKVFNSHRAISVCDDKMETHIALSNCGIPMPKTLSGLLCFEKGLKVRSETVQRVVRALGLPVIVKTSFGSLGKGVFKADNEDQLASVMQQLIDVPHLFQEYVSTSAGKDLRVIVIGGTPIAAMRRISKTDFRSNIGLGGQGQVVTLTSDLCALSTRVAETLGLDYCGIDFLYGEKGLQVCEVNSNAFFGEMERVSGINVARQYAAHIVKTLNLSR